jgi:hypothetical protein
MARRNSGTRHDALEACKTLLKLSDDMEAFYLVLQQKLFETEQLSHAYNLMIRLRSFMDQTDLELKEIYALLNKH